MKIYNLKTILQLSAWMRANSYLLFEAKAGAHANNVIFGEGFLDTDADQRAIENGHNYMTNQIQLWRK